MCSSVLYASQITQLDGIRFTCATIKQSFSSCRTHPPNNHVWNLRLSLAWHTREQQTQSTYKGYIIPNHPPNSSFTAHPPLFSLPGYNIRVPQQQVWVPFLNPTLFSIIKKGKRICHGPLCLLYCSLVVWGTHVTLRHRERARVRVVTQPPTLGAVERRGLVRPPIQPLLLLLLSTLNWF